jgi:hypothetical protein
MQLLYAQAAWLRCLTGAAFASLKKCPLEADFFNHTFGVTEPKEAPYETTGNNLKFQALITLRLNLDLYLKQLKPFLNLTRMRTCGIVFNVLMWFKLTCSDNKVAQFEMHPFLFAFQFFL